METGNSGSGQKYNLLFVEDDEVNGKIIELYLRNIYNITWVSDGASAIKKAEENNYDAILMDIGLRGGMSGLEAVAEIRKIDLYKNKPIVAVTAYALNEEREKFLNSGCSHYLSKPFTKNSLLALLAKILI